LRDPYEVQLHVYRKDLLKGGHYKAPLIFLHLTSDICLATGFSKHVLKTFTRHTKRMRLGFKYLKRYALVEIILNISIKKESIGIRPKSKKTSMKLLIKSDVFTNTSGNQVQSR